MYHRNEKESWQLIWDDFKAGDSEAFEIIYNEFIDVLFAYGSKISDNKAMLEDAIHDVFIDIFTYGNRLHHPEYLKFYLFKTLKRNLIRKIKETQLYDKVAVNEIQFDLKFPIEETDGEDYHQEKYYQILKEEIKSLDSKKRELLFLKFNGGFTYVEIGKLLNIKPNTAKKQVHRILKYFKKHFFEKIIVLFNVCLKA